MTEKEVKQLIKLLSKFMNSKRLNDEWVCLPTERLIIQAIIKWVSWYGHDELSMDPTNHD